MTTGTENELETLHKLRWVFLNDATEGHTIERRKVAAYALRAVERDIRILEKGYCFCDKCKSSIRVAVILSAGDSIGMIYIGQVVEIKAAYEMDTGERSNWDHIAGTQAEITAVNTDDTVDVWINGMGEYNVSVRLIKFPRIY